MDKRPKSAACASKLRDRSDGGRLTAPAHFFGDSFVAGFGIAPGEGWVDLIARRCAERGAPIEVANHAVPGETSLQAVERWLNTAPGGRVVFSFGTNDAVLHLPREMSCDALERALLRAAENSVPAFVAGPPPIGDMPAEDAELKQLSADFQRICSERSVPFVPTHAALGEFGPWRVEAAEGDGSHPRARGHQQLAELLENAGLVEWLTAPTR